jgi:hypothetical protein
LLYLNENGKVEFIMVNTIRQTSLFSRRDALRNLPANGSRIDPSTTGSAPP